MLRVESPVATMTSQKEGWRDVFGFASHETVSLHTLRATFRARHIGKPLHWEDKAMEAAFREGVLELLGKRSPRTVSAARAAQQKAGHVEEPPASDSPSSSPARSARRGAFTQRVSASEQQKETQGGTFPSQQPPKRETWEVPEAAGPSPQPSDKAMSAMRKASKLLRNDSFSKMVEALGVIDRCRREDGPSSHEEQQLDHLEAEAMRQYAKHQANYGRQVIAVREHLTKAIRLDPDRALLYVERALYRLQHFSPEIELGVMPQEAHAAAEVKAALQDCEAAIARDETNSAAYELSVLISMAMGDLEGAERIARRGQALSADNETATRLDHDRIWARQLRSGVEDAQALLAPSVRQDPVQAEALVAALLLSPGPRGTFAPPVIYRHLEVLLERADTMRQLRGEPFEDQVASWERAWSKVLIRG